ncbi:MAG: hypothetical protein Q9191_002008 [Dirinaria sp. TL-2023a]
MNEADATGQHSGHAENLVDHHVMLAYQSIGVIYGDIGTSPLYVYSSTFTNNPSRDDLLGALSLIIWTLTLMVSIKYVLIVLRADDEGEGGTFAVYSLLSRHANIVRRDPREEMNIKMERTLTSDLKPASRTARAFIERSVLIKTILKIIGVLGVSLVMSDGVLTPAQSVLGAIQGLKVVNEDMSTATIVGTSCGILILLFLIQPFGTTKIATAFAPVVMVWLIFNMSFGIYNLVHYDHTVLKAFSPFFAGNYLVRNKTDGWRSLGGILLAFTGVEALFADLGAFSRSWVIDVDCYQYTGQAAYISKNGDAFSNPFFNAVPPGMFYPSLVVAILAAVIASQTMITATFQLLSQIIKLSYFPQIKVVHTSKIFHGQIYIPWVNWLLMVGTIVVTAAYNNTTKLGEAYGVCVILVTFITTSMVSLVAVIVWRLPMFLVLFGFLVFGALDGLYLSSALTKIPDGAWFTLVLAILLSSIFILWRYGKENQWKAEASGRLSLSKLFSKPIRGANQGDAAGDPASTGIRLAAGLGGSIISPIKGMGIFFDKSCNPAGTPIVYQQFLQKFRATPAVAVFFHIRPLPRPTVDVKERFTVSRCFSDLDGFAPVQSIFRVTLRHGYTDEVVSPDLGMILMEQVRSFIIREASSPPAEKFTPNAASSAETSSSSVPASTLPLTDGSIKLQQRRSMEQAVRQRLDSLQEAYEDQVIYVVGKEQMRIREGRHAKDWARRIVLAAFLWLRGNTGTKVANLNLDVDKLVEIGFVKVV